MEEMILELIPSLEGQTTLLVLVSVILTMFFASMVYSFLFGLFNKFRS